MTQFIKITFLIAHPDECYAISSRKAQAISEARIIKAQLTQNYRLQTTPVA